MWLLNTRTIALEEFTEQNLPSYAILSHTWSAEEVTFRAIQDHPDKAKSMKGYAKVRDACRQALADSYSYVWVDTCCIQKESSAELSEAINSMFKWYTDAAVCYAYLADVENDVDVSRSNSQFRRSKWFTRGWTLQELLAPLRVDFFTVGWKRLGSKTLLRKQISQITRIDEGILCGQQSIYNASVAKRMSWASSRKTTRTEDLAYCLLGIFNVSMPLLYGEGKKAFRRLQEEIIRVSTDQTIFAWGYRSEPGQREGQAPYSGFLADEPAAFHDIPVEYVVDELSEVSTYAMTNLGLRVDIHRVSYEKGTGFIILPCRPAHEMHRLVALAVWDTDDDDTVVRARSALPFTVDRALALRRHVRPAYLSTRPPEALLRLRRTAAGPPDPAAPAAPHSLIVRSLPPHVSLGAGAVFPRGSYDADLRTITVARRCAVCVDSGRFVILLAARSWLATYERVDEGGPPFDVQAWCESGSSSLHLATPENYKASQRYEAVVGHRSKWIRIAGQPASQAVWPMDIIDNYEDTLKPQ